MHFNITHLLTLFTGLTNMMDDSLLSNKKDISPENEEIIRTDPLNNFSYTRKTIYVYYNDTSAYLNRLDNCDENYLSTFLYVPSKDLKDSAEDAKLPPVIILGHGLGKTKNFWDHWSQYYVSLGYAVLSFDHRNWGESSGDKRLLADVDEQVADYMNIINAIRIDGFGNKVDKNRIILSGYSLGGGHVLTVGKILSKKNANYIKGVIAVVPYVGGSIENLTGATLELLGDSINGLKTNLIRGNCSENGQIKNEISKKLNPFFLTSLTGLLNYAPGRGINELEYPTLFISADLDLTCPARDIKKVYEQLKESRCTPEKKAQVEYFCVLNSKHYGICTKHAEETFKRIGEFLNKHNLFYS